MEAQKRGDAGVDDPGVRAAADALSTFPNAYPDRDYLVTIDAPEFTAVCPMTDQPDFGTILVEYVPNKRLLELKSYKLYLGSYRNVGIFHETVTNTILEDLKRCLDPRQLVVTGTYKPRGGIVTTVKAEWPE
ncbi:MAG: NADPH-dependent 7-cyano-7-deazaguanine reductase QueF [Planctomycetes bacterium]|nr:NADPH-dependent 7-cyano-7-deazaguanine reductase QueF [Planctomycetota bacterium]